VFCEDFDSAWWAMRRHALGFVPEICFAYRMRGWPQTSPRNPVRELRDVAHIMAKNARFFPPHMAEVMHDLALSHFLNAAGEAEAAALSISNFIESRKRYEERTRSNASKAKTEDQASSAGETTESKSTLMHRFTAMQSDLELRNKQAAKQESDAKTRLSETKQKVKQSQDHVLKLQHLLRYHSSNPLRALKLWLKRKSVTRE
jgi:hypothetical protein